MNYVTTKSIKSVGLGILLVLLLGPIGLFYATVTGGLIMTFIVPAFIFIGFFLGITSSKLILIIVIIISVFYYFILMIWSSIAITNYNHRILQNSLDPEIKAFDKLETNQSAYSRYGNNKSSLRPFFIILLAVIVLFVFFLIKSKKESNNSSRHPIEEKANYNQQSTINDKVLTTAPFLDSEKSLSLFKLNTVREIKRIYGENNIHIKNGYDSEGNLIGKDYVLFPNTNDEVTIQTSNEKIINFQIIRRKSRWKIPFDICVGMNLEDVIKANGRDFSIYGFGWDYGGSLASWKEGKLEHSDIMIIFQTPSNIDPDVYSKYTGESEFNTSDKGLKSLKLYVKKIVIK